MSKIAKEYMLYVGADIVEKGQSTETPKSFVEDCITMGELVDFDEARTFLSEFYTTAEVDQILISQEDF